MVVYAFGIFHLYIISIMHTASIYSNRLSKPMSKNEGISPIFSFIGPQK